ERVGERLALGEPAGDRSLVRGGGGERLRGELAPRPEREAAVTPQLVEDEAVALRPAYRRAVGEVLRGAAQHRRPADVDHLDRLLLGHTPLRGDVREGVEVDADQVERL